MTIRKRLSRILGNLLDNSRKYGASRVRIAAIRMHGSVRAENGPDGSWQGRRGRRAIARQ